MSPHEEIEARERLERIEGYMEDIMHCARLLCVTLLKMEASADCESKKWTREEIYMIELALPSGDPA